MKKSSLCWLCNHPLATFLPRSSFSRRIPWCLFGWRSVVIAQTLLSKRCLCWVCARLATIRPHKHTGEFKTFDTCLSCSQAYMILPVCLCGRLILKRIVCLLRSKACLCTAASITPTQQRNRPLCSTRLYTRGNTDSGLAGWALLKLIWISSSPGCCCWCQSIDSSRLS